MGNTNKIDDNGVSPCRQRMDESILRSHLIIDRTLGKFLNLVV